jgi:predicted nucleic acid-binding protein
MSEIVIASNTGPLVSAFQCGRIDLLRRYFGVIHIPETVLLELQRHGAGNAADRLAREGLFVVERLGPDEIVHAEHLARQIAAS